MHLHKWQNITVIETKEFEHTKYTDKEIKYKICEKCKKVKYKYYLLGIKLWLNLEKNKALIIQQLIAKNAEGLTIQHNKL